MNPWLEIPLRDYEAHMALDSVRQAQYLAATLSETVICCGCRSVAVIGCSGGNGFAELAAGRVHRVVGIDINPEYVAAAKERYAAQFDQLEMYCGDITRLDFCGDPVDLIFAGLIFEYVDHCAGLKSALKLMKPEGHLAVVLQLPCDTAPAVTPSPYATLTKLDSVLKFVSPDVFRKTAESLGLAVRSSNRTVLPSGKAFHQFLFGAGNRVNPDLKQNLNASTGGLYDI